MAGMMEIMMATEFPNWATMIYGGACIVLGFYASKLAGKIVPETPKTVGRHRADRIVNR